MNKKKIAVIILLLIFLIAAYQLIRIGMEYVEAADEYESLSAEMETVEEEIIPVGHAETEDAEPEALEEPADDTLAYTYTVTVPEFTDLAAEYSDVVGWVEIPGTVINYPIVQGTDNEYYLTHLYTGEENSNGAIFMDAGTAEGFNDRNAIIFGHNMKNGSMFAALNNYADASYYNEHPCVVITALDGTRYIYDIFSVYYVAPEDEAVYVHGFGADETFEEYLEYVKSLSLYDTGVDVTKDDYIITLSTCRRGSDTDKTVVQAVRR
ncbi:MAG: class B sortase [Clostridiales bacterium]|nr:class B sortase [Clostridiales bacterium]